MDPTIEAQQTILSLMREARLLRREGFADAATEASMIARQLLGRLERWRQRQVIAADEKARQREHDLRRP